MMNPKKWYINCFRLAVIKCLLLYFFIFGFNYIGFSQKEKKIKFLDKKDTVSKKAGFFLFPLLYYTPDTRIAAGLAGVYYFNTGRSDLLQKTRLSYTKLLCDYTQNKQLDFWTSWNIFTNQEKYLFKGEFRYRNFPDKFYGIGNSSNILNLEKYTYDLFKFKLLAMKQVAPKFFVGLDYQYENQFNFSHQVGGELETGSLTGYKGGIGSALGLVATHDTRDNVVNAYSGHILEFSSYLNSSYLGGSFNYVNLNFKFGKYWELKKNNILAVNVIMNSNFGKVPFLAMANVGGDDMIRGYASNRYRDNHFLGAQIEYRFPLWWRFGMVVFTGVGDVYHTPSDIKLNTLKYTTGAGIRLAINTKERLNFRFDYGFGRKSNAFYIMLTEAF